MSHGRIIILEGNISAGKSTLCDALRQSNPNARAFLEPTITNPYLERFYVDPPRYALKMQMWLFRQRYLTYLDALRYVMETGNDAILDRSVYSDWVFAQNGLLDGNISLPGYQYYMSLRQHLLAELPLPHFTVYLRVAPGVCHSRIHNMRKRGCESSIPLEYLEGLHGCYETLLKELSDRGSAVLVFDWGQFGSAGEVWDQLGRYTFEYSEPQWECVKELLEGLEGVDLRGHLWPVHLEELAKVFDEQEEEHGASSMMESEAGKGKEGEKKKEEGEKVKEEEGKIEGKEGEEDNSIVVVRISQGGVRVGLSG